MFTITDANPLSKTHDQILQISRKYTMFLDKQESDPDGDALFELDAISCYVTRIRDIYSDGPHLAKAVEIFSTVIGTRLGDILCSKLDYQWQSLIGLSADRSSLIKEVGVISPSRVVCVIPRGMIAQYIRDSSITPDLRRMFRFAEFEASEDSSDDPMESSDDPFQFEVLPVFTRSVDTQMAQNKKSMRELITRNEERRKHFSAAKEFVDSSIEAQIASDAADKYKEMMIGSAHDREKAADSRSIAADRRYLAFPNGFTNLYVDGRLSQGSAGRISNGDLMSLFQTNIENDLREYGAKVARPVALSPLPFADFNAHALPNDELYIVAMNYGLIDIVRLASKLVFTMCLAEGGPVEGYKKIKSTIPWLILCISELVRNMDDLAFASFREITASLGDSGSIENIKKDITTENKMDFVSEWFSYSILYFVLAHEYGHIALGHLDGGKTRKVVQSAFEEEIVDKDLQMEFDADEFAIELMLWRFTEGYGFGSRSLAFSAIVAFLKLGDLVSLNSLKQYGRDAYDENATHPRPEKRAKAILRSLEKNTEKKEMEEILAMGHVFQPFFKVAEHLAKQ